MLDSPEPTYVDYKVNTNSHVIAVIMGKQRTELVLIELAVTVVYITFLRGTFTYTNLTNLNKHIDIVTKKLLAKVKS